MSFGPFVRLQCAGARLPGAGMHHRYEPDELLYVAPDDGRIKMKLNNLCRYPETAVADTFCLRLEGKSLRFDRSVNVNDVAVGHSG
jgi:hypothetical protein